VVEHPLPVEEHVSLCEALDRVLTKGVVIHGDVTISVADVDLIYLGLRVLLTSVETARRSGAISEQIKLGAGVLGALVPFEPCQEEGP